MINLRFHIVSLVAVFLALAIGIAVGATVVDQGLVSQLNRDIDGFDRQLRERARTIESLKANLAKSDRFATEGEARIVFGRLAAVPVLVVAGAGVDETFVKGVRTQLQAAGAMLQGELRLEPRLAMPADADLTAARAALGAASEREATLRFLLLQRFADAVVKPGETPTLASLAAAAFVEFRSADGRLTATVPALAGGTRIIAVSGASTLIPDTAFLLPFLRAISADGTARALAVEAVSPTIAGAQRSGTVFVSAVRGDPDLATRVSTVDDFDELSGRVAAVFATEDLGRNVVGSYGTGKGATRLLPAA